MTRPLEARLRDALAGTALADLLAANARSFLEHRSGDAAAARLDGAALVGLARVVASQPETAGFLAHRPELFERLVALEPSTLGARERELEQSPPAVSPRDLELSLDTLRLLRREETCVAACCDLGDLAPFEAVSDFLSVLAETIARLALSLAAASVARAEHAFSVLGMGKIAGREFTYHSDLDLIFLHAGSPEQIHDASRIGQRLIAYLTTMTGAGVAYAVDTRLRPSGRQGMLVTSYRSFERYQREEAQTWEHLALLRARAIAGAVEEAQPVLERVRTYALGLHENAWAYLADLRRRVELERAGDEREGVALKTGAGGLMDADFLAGGGLLERGAQRYPTLPSVAAMLRASASGPRVERVLGDYRFLRVVEARTRLVAGRPAEMLKTDDPARLAAVAALVDPKLRGEELLERITAARRRVRVAYDDVVAARTIGALEGAD